MKRKKDVPMLGIILLVLLVIYFSLLGSGTECKRISYGNTKFYLAMPENQTSYALVLIHGGTSSSVKAEELCREFLHFRDFGYAIASVDYEKSALAGKELENVLSVISYLKKNGMENIGVIGISHGGYLALMAAVKTNVSYVIDAYGITNLTAMKSQVYDIVPLALWQELITTTEQECEKQGSEKCLQERSPVSLAMKIDEPVLILHGKHDNVVPVAQSYQLIEAFDKAGKKNYEFHLLYTKAHGFSLLDNEAYEYVTLFMSKYGKKPKANHVVVSEAQ